MSAFGNIRKLPSGNYQARYKINDIEHRAPTTFPTKTMARQWLVLEQSRIIQGLPTTAQTKRTKTETRTCDQLAQQWLTTLERRGFSPDTIRAYKSKWNAHLTKPFGKKHPTKITRKHILTWDQEKDWASETLRRNTLLVLSAFFSYLVDNEIIDQTPVTRIKIGKRNRETKPKNIATPEQITLIRNNMPPTLAIAVDLAAWCTLRFGEVAGLERQDIDLEQGIIHVRRSTHRGVGGVESIGALKTQASNRTVAMPPAMLERMRTHLENHVPPHANAPIVHRVGDPNTRLSNKHLHSYYDPAVAQAGLPGFRFHDLRHTALTLAARAGATLEELKARAGHSSNEMAMHYQTATVERDKLIAERLGG